MPLLLHHGRRTPVGIITTENGGRWIWLRKTMKMRRHARANSGNLQLLGEIKVRIPAVAGAGFLVRAVTSLRNFLSRRAHSVD